MTRTTSFIIHQLPCVIQLLTQINFPIFQPISSTFILLFKYRLQDRCRLRIHRLRLSDIHHFFSSSSIELSRSTRVNSSKAEPYLACNNLISAHCFYFVQCFNVRVHVSYACQYDQPMQHIQFPFYRCNYFYCYFSC